MDTFQAGNSTKNTLPVGKRSSRFWDTQCRRLKTCQNELNGKYMVEY